MLKYLLFGEMAEWFKAPVLKTGVGQLTVGSNPSLSAEKECRINFPAFSFFYYISSRKLYALQLNQNASQGAGVKAPYQSIFLPAPDIVGQNLSRKVRASLDQIRDRSCAPTPRLPYGSYSGSPASAALTFSDIQVLLQLLFVLIHGGIRPLIHITHRIVCL